MTPRDRGSNPHGGKIIYNLYALYKIVINEKRSDWGQKNSHAERSNFQMPSIQMFRETNARVSGVPVFKLNFLRFLLGSWLYLNIIFNIFFCRVEFCNRTWKKESSWVHKVWFFKVWERAQSEIILAGLFACLHNDNKLGHISEKKILRVV